MALAISTKAILRFMDLQGGLFLSDFVAFRKAFHLWKNQSRWRLQSTEHYLFHPYILLISVLWTYSRSFLSG